MNQRSSDNPAQVYEEYFVPAIFLPWTRVLLDHAAPQTGEHMLDVACGTGIVARLAAPLLGKSGSVVAIDINTDMLTVARALPEPKGAAVEWCEGDAFVLPDGPFDLIMCQHGLQFFSDTAAALSEMRRALKIAGRVVLNVWQPLELHVVFECLLEATARHLDATVDVLAHAWSLGDAEELRAFFDSAGFQQVKISQVSLPIRFPSPDRFVELTILAGATTIPAFAQLDEPGRLTLVETVKNEVAAVLQRYLDGGTVTFPTHAHVVIAHS